MRAVARQKRDTKIDELLAEGWSVRIIAETVGATERIVYGQQAKRRGKEVAEDPLLAELAELEKIYPTPPLPDMGGVLDFLEQYKALA